MNNGWIKLYRKSLKSSIWDNHNAWRVWCWCLMKTSHKESKFPFNGQDYILKPGQFITGRVKACKELRLTNQKYRTALEYLKSSQRINVKTTNKFTLISVINWGKYQIDNQQKENDLTNKQPTDNQPVTTYKKNKNVKNYYVFSDKTEGFLDKRDNTWKEVDTYKKLGNIYLKELDGK